MYTNESDSESIFPRLESPHSIPLYEDESLELNSMNYENDEMIKKLEFGNQIDFSKDISTAITKQETKTFLGNKINPLVEDERIEYINEIKPNSNEFNEEKKNEDFNHTILKIFDKKKEEESFITPKEEEDVFLKKKIPKKEKKEKILFYNKSDLISQNNDQKVRFDIIVKKVKKLFFHYIVKITNEILKKKGISKNFRIPSHDFIKNVTIQSNKFILTIDIKSLFCSTFKKNSQIGDVLKKKIQDNKFIFEKYSFLEKEYSHIFCTPLEFLLNDYLHSEEFIGDVKDLNSKCKKNPIKLERIIGEGDNNLINYFKFNNRYGKK